MTSLNDIAWARVFEELGLLEAIQRDGYVKITASALKEAGHREPRLMAKQDTLESRPDIFRRNHLAILPIRNGEYIIFSDKNNRSYYIFDSGLKEVTAVRHDSIIDADRITTLNLSSITSEFQAIDYAHLASVLRTFTSEPNLFLTIRGKYRSNPFSINLPGIADPVAIKGVQIEIDSGYEGENGVYLIEAKLGKREDFHIRQLFFPLKDWSTRTNKPIIPIFFTYSNGLFCLTKVKFGDDYGEVTISDHRCYSINEDPVLVVDFADFLQSVPNMDTEPIHIPFPQANDLDKIIDLIVSSTGDPITKESIAEHFEFDERQGDYYANATIYLGFLERNGNNSGLLIVTDLGKEMQRCRTRRCRHILLLRQLLQRPTFRETITRMNERGFVVESVPVEEIEEIINEFDGRYNPVTCHRRASTVRSWLKWISLNVQFNH